LGVEGPGYDELDIKENDDDDSEHILNKEEFGALQKR
jgi:hypothetical protein